MKLLKYIITLCVVMFGFQSCETYDDMEVEYSPIFPLSGEWIVYIYDASTGTMIIPDSKNDYYTCYTYNTSANDADKMWVKLSTTESSLGVGKVNCDPKAKTFSIENGVLSSTNTGFQLLEGSVVLDGYDTKTGGKADAIQFKLKTDKSTVTYLVKGFRRTGWLEDL